MSCKNPIPAYWENHVKEKIQRIHNLQAKGGKNCVSVGMITDYHMNTNAHNSPALMERILTECAIPYFFNGGDTVSGCGLCWAEFITNEIDEFRRLFAPIEHKCLMAEGNHDRAYSLFDAPEYYVQNLSYATFYEHCFRFQSQYPDRVIGKTGTYFYADSKAQKTRFVVLDSQDTPSDEELPDGKIKYNAMLHFGFLQEQIDWFANVALDVPDSDWNVIVCSHANPAYRGDSARESVYNYDVMLGIINAFRKHTAYKGEGSHANPIFKVSADVDFTGKGGNFIAWLGGHTHRDAISLEEGVVCISTQSDCAQAAAHIKGTDTEQAFDIFTICPDEKKVYVTRIGEGPDREFTYETFK